MKRLFFSIAFAILLSACGKEMPQEPLEIMKASVIVGELNWQEITTLTADDPIRVAAGPVADIDLPIMGSRCTGFLVASDILMTNQHCVPSSYYSRGLTASFRHEAGVSQEDWETFDCSEFIGNDRELDFALLRCQGNPGAKFGFVQLADEEVAFGTDIYLVQQNCDYYTKRDCDWTKKFAFGSILRKRGTGLVHNADTLGGSSGSPVFDRQTHKVVAIHHAGLGNNGMGRGFENYAIPMEAIYHHILSHYPEVELNSAPVLANQHTSLEAAVVLEVQAGMDAHFSIEKKGDIHYYLLNLAQATRLELLIQFSHAIGDLDLYIYDAHGRYVASSAGIRDQERIMRTLEMGEYIVTVRGFRGAVGDYQLILR